MKDFSWGTKKSEIHEFSQFFSPFGRWLLEILLPLPIWPSAGSFWHYFILVLTFYRQIASHLYFKTIFSCDVTSKENNFHHGYPKLRILFREFLSGHELRAKTKKTFIENWQTNNGFGQLLSSFLKRRKSIPSSFWIFPILSLKVCPN